MPMNSVYQPYLCISTKVLSGISLLHVLVNFLMIRMSKLFKLIHYTHQIGTCRLLSYTYRLFQFTDTKSRETYDISLAFGPIPKLVLVLSYLGILKYLTDLNAESEP